MTQLTKYLLPKLGAPRNMPLEYRYAPKGMQGLGIPDPYVEQGIAQLKILSTHGGTDTLTGQFIQVSLDQMQLEVGTCKPVLSAPFRLFGHLATDCWLKCLWQFTDTFKIKVSSPPSTLPSDARENDCFLMDYLTAKHTFSPSQLAAFNRVRLFFQVATLADITTGDGKTIRDEFFSDQRDTDYKSVFIWQLEEPQPSDYRIWKAGLRAFCHLPKQLREENRLGRWINGKHHVSEWPWFFDPSTRSLLYVDGSTQIQRYETSHTRPLRSGSNFRRDIHSVITEIPATAQRATATWITRHEVVRFDGADATAFTPIPALIPQTVGDMRDDSTWWPLHNSTFPSNLSRIRSAIDQGTALGVCDGSYMPNRNDSLGATAWRLEDPISKSACQGTCQTAGAPADVNAYRSELQGLHATLLAILLVCVIEDINKGSVTIGCDNETAINQARTTRRHVTYSTKHTDMIRAIQTVTKQIEARGVKLVFTHVKGHQDDTLWPENLPRIAQLNIKMDDEAKTCLHDIIQRPTTCRQDLLGEGWTITVAGNKLSNDPTPSIRRHILGQELRDFQIKRGRMSATAYDNIDWISMEGATSTMPAMFSLWMAKHVSGFCAVNNQMFYRKDVGNKACPCCAHLDEHSQHIVECPAPAMKERWMSSLDSLEAWFNETQTHPDIAACFLATLRGRNTLPFSSYTTIHTLDAAAEQDDIGYINTTEGKVSKRWLELQKTHYREIQSRRTAKVWARGLIYQLLILTHNQWKQRNEKVHEKAANGLPIGEAETLSDNIKAQFALGIDVLDKDHRYYLERWTLQEVLAFPGRDQLSWMQGIEIARTIAEIEHDPSMTQMQECMANWLGQTDTVAARAVEIEPDEMEVEPG